MTEFFTQFHFLRPYWLLAIVPSLILLAMLWRQHQNRGNWKRVISPELLQHLIQGKVEKQSRLPVYL
jgi:Ca-activated chloride channel family protein